MEPTTIVRTKDSGKPLDPSTDVPSITAKEMSSDAQPGESISDIIGIFEDEPLWDEVMAEVKAFRTRQITADAQRQATK